jgi:probable O-glycosylation ligase (exosortase A-associated)
MRDIALLGTVLIGLGATFRWPYIGVLLWSWITLMDPHQLAFGFATSFPINLMVAVVTLLSLAFSRENKSPPRDAMLAFTVLFLIWITGNGFLAVDPNLSWPLWDRTWKIILLGVVVATMATNRTRIHALILVAVMSLMYYGVKGGLFTLMTGGNFRVEGPGATTIGDNNQLALAILMMIPLANYLRLHSAHLYVRYILLAAMVLSMISVLGSYSRGAFLALAGLLVVAWLGAKKKFLYPFIAAAIVIPAWAFMPQSYVDRINTIQNAGSDSSFQGRLAAWKVALGYAEDHLPFGAGFAGATTPQIFARYAPGEDSHAAHSIYFEVLGDNGFVGLALYLVILFLCFWNTFVIRKRTKRNPEMAWMYDLAGMLQLMLFVFCVGGAALSFAYYDMLFISAGLLSAMRAMVPQTSKWRAKVDVASAMASPAAG